MFDLNSAIEKPWTRQRLRVPPEDGALFARPALGECVAAVGRNAAALNASSIDIQGRSLHHMREWSRSRLFEEARNYTTEVLGAAASGTGGDVPDGPILVGGHQPSLFHAGVWVKNLAIHHLAKQTDGTSVNLVVDNDTVSARAIRVPRGDGVRPRVEWISYDREQVAAPWEDAGVTDRELFASFGGRVESAMSDWSIRPVLAEMWPDVVEQIERTGSLRDGFTAARSRLEHRWGLGNLELPISRMCETDPFLWFAGHLFAHADRFQEIHNAVLAEFRSINRVRSRTHPVSELVESDGWLESPFWVFRNETTRRERLMVRPFGNEIHLAAGNETFARLPLTPRMDACCAVEVLRELPARGIRLRTRALTTTLFARLCFGDLFVHGIGGSKYDEMTDRIIARFFQISAPEFLTLSATLRLPLAEPHPVSAADLSRLVSKRRDSRYNPDRWLDPGMNHECEQLIAEKRRLIDERAADRSLGLSRSERRRRSSANFARFRRLREINDSLISCTNARRRELERDIEHKQDELAANAVLLDREYPFCLFPEENLRSLMETIGSGIES